MRTGRAKRRPQRQAHSRQQRFTHPTVMIGHRPAEANDRAVPGHWEGNLIVGSNSRSAIATLVERSTRYLMLMHLPQGSSAAAVRDALVDAIQTLPEHLTRSLTWDQGSEMASHHTFSVTTGIPLYFCNAGSPWQGGSNEKRTACCGSTSPGTDQARHTPEHLDTVAAELNSRPRKTLDWETPAERLSDLPADTSVITCCDDHWNPPRPAGLRRTVSCQLSRANHTPRGRPPGTGSRTGHKRPHRTGWTALDGFYDMCHVVPQDSHANTTDHAPRSGPGADQRGSAADGSTLCRRSEATVSVYHQQTKNLLGRTRTTPQRFVRARRAERQSRVGLSVRSPTTQRP
ncbi:IS30 family transposase [Streptomyces sp. NPDC059467]|uniref:IS30 family transposase n=1 Tax=Streptomyces sp. NPDC059467 TaxID=3346844 RepID=UPI0036CC9C8E